MNSLFSNNYTINHAKKIGFDLCGVVKPYSPNVAVEKVEEWLSDGCNASMDWFLKNKKQRYDPRKLTETSKEKSLIVCGLSYQLPMHLNNNSIAAYAHFKDYHITIKEKLNLLHSSIEKELGCTINARTFVDSAPLLERYWAYEAGFGWIGRNSMLINRDIGSMFFIGSLLIDLEFDQYNTPLEFDGCNGCNNCVKECKNGAIKDNRTIDCNNCLSYITIEEKLPFSQNHVDAIKKGKNKVFGCDDCLRVCPWNIISAKNIDSEIEQKRKEKLSFMPIPLEIADIREFQIHKLSPLKRAGKQKIDEIIRILEK